MALTPAELLEKALNGESLDGDDVSEATTTTTQEEPKNNDAEGAADAAKAGAADQGKTTGGSGTTTEDDEPKGAPIASKSGSYTIPYEKLEQARDRAKTLEGENESLRAQLAELNAKQQANLEKAEDNAQDRADAGQAQTQADQNLAIAKEAISKGADPALFGDFSEEGIAKGVSVYTESLVDKAEARINSRLESRLEKILEERLAPLKAREAQEVKDSHYSAIYEKHPDANEIVQSAEFDAWIKSLPGFQRGAVAAVMDPEKGGTAADVIEVFDTFKAQTGKAAAPAAQDKSKALEVQRRVPNSLSEASGEQHQDVAQQVLASAGTNPNALLERMQDMTPEQIERVMNAV